MKKMTKTTKTFINVFITVLMFTTSLLAQGHKKAQNEIISAMGTVPGMFKALPEHNPRQSLGVV